MSAGRSYVWKPPHGTIADTHAGVAELEDAPDLGSGGAIAPCGFESHRPHRGSPRSDGYPPPATPRTNAAKPTPHPCATTSVQPPPLARPHRAVAPAARARAKVCRAVLQGACVQVVVSRFQPLDSLTAPLQRQRLRACIYASGCQNAVVEREGHALTPEEVQATSAFGQT